INTLALGMRLPTMFIAREYVEAGGLISYGANFLDLYRRTAAVVDKILRGTKPSDIPVEQPTKFDLIVNLTTAKALGLTMPSSLLARADEVIEGGGANSSRCSAARRRRGRWRGARSSQQASIVSAFLTRYRQIATRRISALCCAAFTSTAI